jgi:membrane-associated phospholipid phosphatase
LPVSYAVMAAFRSYRPSARSMTVAAAALAVVALATALTTIPPSPWEIDLFHAINGLPDVPAAVWWPVMQFGALGGAAAVTVALLAFRRPRLALAFGVSSGLAWFATDVFKSVIDRARPFDLGIDVAIRGAKATGSGFPSGHSATAFAGAIVLVFVLTGWWRVVPFVIAVLVGVARIYVGAHLPLDVLGGAGVGVFIGVVLHAVTHWPDVSPRPEVAEGAVVMGDEQ